MIQKLQHQFDRLESATVADPIVLCAADDNYVRPLAVALHSAASNLADGRQMKAIVLDGGISETNWAGLNESLVDCPVDLFAIKPPLELVSNLEISHHISHAAYLRLLAGRVLPDDIDKVIYLDADVLVRDDIGQLWDLPLGQQYALAVPDIACPYVDMRQASCNFRRSSPWVSSISPIANWRELGLDGAAPYFNSGVMVLNIQRMREEQIERRLLACLRKNAPFVWCWDQYALNVVFSGQWSPISLRWNQGAHIFDIPDEDHSPLNVEEFLLARDDPSIVHFTTEWKPWDYGSSHPLTDLYFDQLDQTAWSGWRPERPRFNLRRSWERMATETVKRTVIGYRKIAARLNHNACRMNPEELVYPGEDSRTIDARENASPLLTLFAVPKAFEGRANIIQRNAINSWKRLGPEFEVVLIGDDPGVADAAAELEVKHCAEIERNESGTPLVSSAFDIIERETESPYLVYCNCDILLQSDFRDAVLKVIELQPEAGFLAIGRRTNLTIERTINFDSAEDIQKLRQQVAESGHVSSIVCKEYFVFPRRQFLALPEFAVGRGNWDNWLVKQAKDMEIPVINLSDAVTVIHQQHDYAHLRGNRWSCYVAGLEAKQNMALAGGRNLITGSTSDLRLRDGVLENVRLKSVNGEFWFDFPAFARLLADLVLNR